MEHVHERLRQGFENLPEYVDYGGCGFVAIYLHKVLKRIGAEPKIIALNRSEDDLHKCHVNQSERYRVAAHYAVELDGILYDGTGEVSPKYWKTVEIPKSYLKNVIKYGSWNGMFNRNTQTIKQIAREINSISNL